MPTLQDTKLVVHVVLGHTLLQVPRRVGIDLASNCEEALCGSCEVRVINGEIEHSDKFGADPKRAGPTAHDGLLLPREDCETRPGAVGKSALYKTPKRGKG